jgi:hypothetical protein
VWKNKRLTAKRQGKVINRHTHTTSLIGVETKESTDRLNIADIVKRLQKVA